MDAQIGIEVAGDDAMAACIRMDCTVAWEKSATASIATA
jgi:hypothetical protein